MIALSIVCGVLGVLVIFMAWYIKQVLQRLLFVSDNIGDLLETMKTLGEHLESVHEMETFYGEPILQELIRHTKDIVKEVKRYEEIYSLTGGEEDDGNTGEGSLEKEATQ